jgi:integrase
VATIEQRGDRYRVVWRVGGNKQSLAVATLAEAKAVRVHVESKHSQITRDQMLAILLADGDIAGEPVATFCARHVASISGIEGATRKEYARIVRDKIAGTDLGRTLVPNLTREKVRLWLLAQERAGLAPKSIANHHSVLSAAMKQAVAQGLASTNPCHGVRLPRRDDHTTLEERIYLEPGEVRAVASRLPSWCGHVPMLLARTGLRWSELTALQVGDVDLLASPARLRVARAWKRQADGGWKVGRPKSRKSRRSVTLDPVAVDLLAPLVAGKGKAEPVITTADGVHHLPRSTFIRHWSAALDALLAEGMLERRPRIYDLRHTCASWLIGNGASMYDVQEQLGHENITTTITLYTHLTPQGRQSILDAMARLDSAPVGHVDDAVHSRV